jgi:hypothetical protein
LPLPPTLEESKGIYRAWCQSLAAFLLVGGPLPAQAQEEPPLKMVYAVWKDIGGAANTMRHMNKKTYDLVEAYAVLVKDTAGKVEVSQRHNKAGGSARAMQASETIDTRRSSTSWEWRGRVPGGPRSGHQGIGEAMARGRRPESDLDQLS